MPTSQDVMLLIMAKSTRLVVDGAGPVPVEIRNIKWADEGTTMDEDFERIDNEVGMFVKFHCHGDPAVRRFLYSRSIIDSRTFAPKACEWKFEHGEGEEMGTVAFLGRLYNYDERTIGEGKAIEMSGRIRVAD